MIDSSMITRLAAQCGIKPGTAKNGFLAYATHAQLEQLARACYAAGQRDKAEECGASLRKELSHYGIGTGEPNHLLHFHEDGTPAKDRLSFDGELLFGIDALIDKVKADAIRARTEGKTNG
jgi:hypothetical protein